MKAESGYLVHSSKPYVEYVSFSVDSFCPPFRIHRFRKRISSGLCLVFPRRTKQDRELTDMKMITFVTDSATDANANGNNTERWATPSKT